MAIHVDFESWEAKARRAGIPMFEVCKSAGIAHSTWCRWKNGQTPKLASLNKVLDILDSLVIPMGKK